MSALSESMMSACNFLGGCGVQLQLLIYFYKHKDSDTLITPGNLHKLIKGKSNTSTTHYLHKMLRIDLIKLVSSSQTKQKSGYTISVTGIFFFEMYKTIEEQVA